ncbi:hypothetical protein [Streptomyces sp. NBC_01618]|uniref:hypothetical protein n=1 Tax=Streptomyces sp. NBC_01618 TaxID=2975900 RepID=UPI003867FA54|nr:hypothetical protein OH735_05005 [Streptomyces sp. NBC_01618]
MSFLTDAELALGLSRHLSVYQMGPERAALEQLEFAGWVFDVAFRLQGSTTSSAGRVKAIGLDVGLGPRNLRDVIATMETLGWVTTVHDVDRQLVSITESIPAAGDLIMATPKLFRVLMVGPVELAALALLRATTLQPLLEQDALQAAATADGVKGHDEAADAALRHLTHTGLIRRVIADDGREVLYNPNVWTQGDDSVAKAALKAADARATAEVTALLEEIALNPGMPETHVQSTEAKWVDFAVSQNLVQRSVIQTSEDAERGFLFTPHIRRDPFGGTAGDASGHVRQLVGSMIYAATFAKFKLHSPEVFLRALINRGVAGNTSNVGTDYPMLEKAGVVKVVGGYQSDRYRLQLLQPEVAQDALQMLNAREGTGTERADAAALRAQRSYRHVEQERARLALTSDVDKIEEARLIAALREVPVNRMMGGGK